MHSFQLLILRMNEHRNEKGSDGGTSGGSSVASGASGSAQVNKAIQLLAQRYCGDCKTSFDEVSFYLGYFN